MKLIVKADPQGQYRTQYGLPVAIVEAPADSGVREVASIEQVMKLARLTHAPTPPEEAYQSKLQEGFADEELGITIGIGQSDFFEWMRLHTLLQSAGKVDSFEITIADKDGHPHQITWGQYKALLQRAGWHVAKLWGARLKAKQAAETASEAVDIAVSSETGEPYYRKRQWKLKARRKIPWKPKTQRKKQRNPKAQHKSRWKPKMQRKRQRKPKTRHKSRWKPQRRFLRKRKASAAKPRKHLHEYFCISRNTFITIACISKNTHMSIAHLIIEHHMSIARIVIKTRMNISRISIDTRMHIARISIILCCFASLCGCATQRPPMQPVAAVRAQQATKTAADATRKASDAVARAQTALAQITSAANIIQPAAQPATQHTAQPATKSITQSITQPSIQSTTQSTTQSSTHPTAKSTLPADSLLTLPAAVLADVQLALSTAQAQLAVAMDTTIEAYAAAECAVNEAQQLHAQIECMRIARQTAETKLQTMTTSRDRWQKWTFYLTAICSLSLVWILRNPLLSTIRLLTL